MSRRTMIVLTLAGCLLGTLPAQSTPEKRKAEAEKRARAWQAYQKATAHLLKPREIYPIVAKDMIPADLKIESDRIVASDTVPGLKLRRIEARFNSLELEGRKWIHPCVILMPADKRVNDTPERKGRIVIVSSPGWAMYPGHVEMYGEPIASRTLYPTMVLHNPGIHPDGQCIEGGNLRVLDRIRKERNTNYYSMNCQLALVYIRAMDVMEGILGVKRVSAVLGGHSKRGRSATVAAAMDDRVASPIIMGNEGVFDLDKVPWHLHFHHSFFQEQVKVPVLYIGATNEGGYRMFNINRMQERLVNPMTIEMIPNYRHYNFHEKQYMDFLMWTTHIFDKRPISRIVDIKYERRNGRNWYSARVVSKAKVQLVRVWYVYADNPYWTGLTWYEWIMRKKGDHYETSVPGTRPDAFMIEVADKAHGNRGYFTSLPIKISDAPVKERNPHKPRWAGHPPLPRK